MDKDRMKFDQKHSNDLNDDVLQMQNKRGCINIVNPAKKELVCSK